MNEDIMRETMCKKCGREMEFLGNVGGIVYTTYPEMWDETYVCDNCKTKTIITTRRVVPDNTGGRNLDEYLTQ
jgi:hypothetical protein